MGAQEHLPCDRPGLSEQTRSPCLQSQHGHWREAGGWLVGAGPALAWSMSSGMATWGGGMVEAIAPTLSRGVELLLDQLENICLSLCAGSISLFALRELQY